GGNMRVAPPVILSEEQREELGTFSRGRRTAVRVVERARIILLCADGKQNREIAELLGTTRRTVGLWRRRFVQNGIAGIEKDAPRPGGRSQLPKRWSKRWCARPRKRSLQWELTGAVAVWPR